MVFDAQSTTASSSAAGLLDVQDFPPPPSYDEAEASSSAAGAAAGELSWASQAALFTGPPNAEPLSAEAVAGLPEIPSRKLFNQIEVSDRRIESPTALLTYLRAEALKPPSVEVRVAAFHWETSPRQQFVVENGVPRQVHAGQRYRVTDFDFTIDLSPNFAHENNKSNVSLFCLPSTVPARRGAPWRTFGSSAFSQGTKILGRRPTREESKRWDAYETFKQERGRAPWSDIAADDEFWAQYSRGGGSAIALGGRPDSDEEALISSLPGDNDSLRSLCTVYSNDGGLMKSFVLSKRIYAWDFANLRKAITRTVLSTGYMPTEDTGGISVELKSGPECKVVIKPDTWFTRLYHGPGFLHVAFMILFFWVYPFFVLWQLVDNKGASGPYEVAVAGYSLKSYPPLPGTFLNESVEQARHRLPSLFKTSPELPPSPQLVRGPKGVHYILGRREGEWFREWEERIRMAVRMRYTGVLENPNVIDDGTEGPELDGYTP